MKKAPEPPAPDSAASEDFLTTLEAGVKAVLADKKAKASERVAAITAGVKVMAIRHKIAGGDDGGFFG